MLDRVFTFILLISSFYASAQIDLNEGTVYAIAHWKMGEVKDYKVAEVEVSTIKEDTIGFDNLVYDVQVKVVDSTSVGYILEWTRKNLEFSAKNILDAQLRGILAEIPILIKTNVYGTNIEVLNWEDLAAKVVHDCNALLVQYHDQPANEQKIKKTLKLFANKESIQDQCVLDVQQMFVYHGAKYLLGETVKTDLKVLNNYGGDPLDATAALVLDEILPQNGTFIVKSFQNINPQQLKAVTYDYISKLNIEGQDLPQYEDFPTITKQIWGGAEIHANSGWVIYSQESQQVSNGESITTDERIIEIILK